jgi:hypothetical protein
VVDLGVVRDVAGDDEGLAAGGADAAATSSQGSRLRLETTTRAPARARVSAMARPMPRLEPVMTATWSRRSTIGAGMRRDDARGAGGIGKESRVRTVSGGRW